MALSRPRRMREVGPGDPTPRGPYVRTHPDGTRQHVYGGPNYRPPLTARRRARVVWGYTWPWLLLAGVVAAMVLTARRH